MKIDFMPAIRIAREEFGFAFYRYPRTIKESGYSKCASSAPPTIIAVTD
jgi:hypothetical protein